MMNDDIIIGILMWVCTVLHWTSLDFRFNCFCFCVFPLLLLRPVSAWKWPSPFSWWPCYLARLPENLVLQFGHNGGSSFPPLTQDQKSIGVRLCYAQGKVKGERAEGAKQTTWCLESCWQKERALVSFRFEADDFPIETSMETWNIREESDGFQWDSGSDWLEVPTKKYKAYAFGLWA